MRLVYFPLALNLKVVIFLFLSFDSMAFAPSSVDWAQPPAACVEEAVPRLPDRNCLDLSTLLDPRSEFPSNISQSDLAYWQDPNQKLPLAYCRAREVLRRERIAPGSFPAASVQSAWMRVIGVDRREEKIEIIYESSRQNRMPAQILTGAIMQESLFSDMGIAEDGSNYSCGAGQINVLEWCRWANAQNTKTKNILNWPISGVNCRELTTEMVKPFFDIAKKRLNGLPEYKLNKSHFSDIRIEDVANKLPTSDNTTLSLRFQMITSFIQNCSEPKYGIPAKANELKNVFNLHVPSALKSRDQYSKGESYSRICRDRGDQTYYPLSLGWLLAVGIYNAGPRVVDLMAHYYSWDSSDLARSSTFANLDPSSLIEAFYWGGKYSPVTDKMHFTTIQGKSMSWIWFKSCVLQRHIARVLQNATLPNAPKLADSLEGSYKCTRSEFDPVTGDLVSSSVPPFRQSSSGVYETKRRR